jgi:hypothetical protein
MADTLDPKPTGTESPAPERPTVKARRPKRRRSLDLDREAVTKFVLDTLKRDMDDRQERINNRMNRYAQLRGWLPSKTWPFENCANFWVSAMLTASMRLCASLANSCKATRPLVEARALQRRNKDKQEKIDNTLDYQFFTENKGEAKIDELVFNFVHDEAVFTYTPWVRESQTVREVKMMPGWDDNVADHGPQLLAACLMIFGEQASPTMADASGFNWEVAYTEGGQPKVARVEFFDTEDNQLEAYITKDVRTFDGPAPQVLDFEDVVFPVRSANLQPPSGANPHGAPHVHHICTIGLDAIRRRMDGGEFDLLTEEDWDAIKGAKSPAGDGSPEDEPKTQKDKIGGETITVPGDHDDGRQLIVTYAGWDVDGNGYEEQVILWTIRLSTGKGYPAAVRYLSELYPGTPLMRPVDSESIFPIPNRVYGISFDELIEAIQEMKQASMNQHFDWGTITNVPFFFYRAASGVKPEPIYMEPGQGYPLDDPQRDVLFPQWGQRGETFNINTMSLLQQQEERLSMQSDLSFGRVPTGKSAALRTVGTTNALLSQIDVRSEEVLRRLFHLIARVFQMAHRLNRRYLPPLKEIRIMGMSEANAEPYKEIKAEEVDADVDFTFKATMFNTNKQMVAQALMQSIGLAMSPLALQAGLVTERELYNLYRDIYQAQDLDPDKYVKRPAAMVSGPKFLAEEAFGAIVAGEMPQGSPLEPAMEHYQKFAGFAQSAQPFGATGLNTAAIVQAFTPDRQQMYQAWLAQVQQQVVMEQMRQQMMMAAVAGQQPGGNGGEGPGGAPTTVSSDTGGNPPVNKNEAVDESAAPVQ